MIETQTEEIDDDWGDNDLLLLSEPALADWLRPEEDEAWAYLQPTIPS